MFCFVCFLSGVEGGCSSCCFFVVGGGGGLLLCVCLFLSFLKMDILALSVLSNTPTRKKDTADLVHLAIDQQ